MNAAAAVLMKNTGLNGTAGQWTGAVVAVIAAAIVYVCLYYRAVLANSRYNAKADANPKTATRGRLINDQNGITGHCFRYGLFAARLNSCEAIAVHNAKTLMGIDSSLSQTMHDFQRARTMVLLGAWGSNPYAIGRLLKKEGIACRRISLTELNRGGLYIISFWNRNKPWHGLHTVALSYDGKIYTTYNLNGGGTVSNRNPQEYASDYICGYSLKSDRLQPVNAEEKNNGHN